ncbi:DUF6624 domain-containing protein [Caulobacter sp. ErkDOM-E]|uniref:DUF6624 domain-containing protein n=1 Tax=Caulobacter sp. ErkDOM-E TaxID=3402778 RepID=UPI003AF44653
MSGKLADRLVALAAQDLETRERLAKDGSVFDGYHPEMQVVHEANAGELEKIIEAVGWPTRQLVGDEGAEAAWLIAQHAIGLPRFQRKCLELLQSAVASGDAPAWQMAMMLDRILTYEGRPQVYGTSFDWDDDGQLSPGPIEDPGGVDQRRAEIDLEPLETAVSKLRSRDANHRPPADMADRRRRMDEWARQVGWR